MLSWLKEWELGGNKLFHSNNLLGFVEVKICRWEIILSQTIVNRRRREISEIIDPKEEIIFQYEKVSG